MYKQLAFAVVGTCLVAGSASAETKSWAVMKNKLPADAAVVFSLDGKQLKTASSFPKLVDSLFSSEKDVKEAVDMVKTVCAIDIVASIADVTVALNKDDKGVVAVGLDGLDETKLVDCATKLAKHENKAATLTSRPAGAGKEYTFSDGGSSKDVMYAAWPTKDVIVFGTKPNKQIGLDIYSAGKAPSGEIATYISKAAGGAAWLAVSVPVNKDGVKGGYGTVTLSRGTLAISGRFIADTATNGAKNLKEAQADLTRAIDRSSSTPAVQKLLKSVKLVGAGTDVTIDLNVPEADLPTLLPMLDKIF